MKYTHQLNQLFNDNDDDDDNANKKKIYWYLQNKVKQKRPATTRKILSLYKH